jgi:hypothetical protein
LGIGIERGPRREFIEALEAVQGLEQLRLRGVDDDRALDVDLARQQEADHHDQDDQGDQADDDALQDRHA